MNAQIKINVNGRVQGVGFRWFISQKAFALNLTGFVRNLHNGSVEIIAEGEKEHLEQLVQISQKGPTFSKVTEMQTNWFDYSGEFETFEITH